MVKVFEVPARGWFEFSAPMSALSHAQVNKGVVLSPYEEYAEPTATFPTLTFTSKQKNDLLSGITMPSQNKKGLEVSKNGNEIKVTSKLDNNVLVNNLSLSGSANGAFNISITQLNGQTIHAMSDDITPIRTFYTVGANHGYPCHNVNKSEHGKTTADLGSVWTDGANDFILVKVSGDTMTFISDYVVASDGTHSNKASSMGSTLTHKSGATNTSQITSITVPREQLYPSIKNIDQKLNIPIENGTYDVDKFVIKEAYEILDYKSLVDWCKSHVGQKYESNLAQIDSVTKYTTTYSYSNFGKCLVNSSVIFHKKSKVQNTGFLQSARLGPYAVRYMPDIKPINSVDFKQGVNLNTYTSNLIVDDDDLLDASYPPTRYVDTADNYGYTMGYVPDKMTALSSKRLDNASQYWDLRGTGKSYPVAFNQNAGIAEPGDYFAVEGYRNYFIKDSDLTLFDEVEDGEAYYVFIDAHKSIPYLTREVSAKAGSRIEIIKQDGIELLNDYVSAEGIAFKVPGSYGQMVMKILK